MEFILALRKTQVLKESVVLAKQKLDAEIEKYEKGVLSNKDVLELIDQYETMKLKESKSIILYNKALASLKQLTGAYIEENNIEILQ